MGFRKVLDEVETLDEYKDMDDDYYLAHAFVNKYGETPWEIGYYNEEKELMKVFGGDPVDFIVEDEVLKRNNTINELDLDAVEVEFETAKETGEDELEELDVNGNVNRLMGILQNLDEHVWNLTFVTDALEVANIKVNAEDGSIYESRKDNLMNMTKFDDGE